MDAVGICNLALGHIDPHLSIQSLDEEVDESTQAAACALRFAAVRDAVLGEGPWRFALQRHEIAADATAPAYGPGSRYQLPAAVIQVTEVSDGDVPLEDWQREGQYIVTDQETRIFIRSVDQVEDVSLWPPGFVQAVATRLAAELCPVLSENRARASDLWQLYQRHLHEALMSDGQQSAQRTYTQSALSTVRGWRT